MVYSISHDSYDDKRHHVGMMSRRNGGCLRFLLIIAIMAFFLYGIYLYHDVQTRLKKSEDRGERYKQQHDSISAQLQVVYEHKSRLEKSLQNEKADHKKSKDELLAQKQDIENKANSEKQELLNRINSINQEHKMLQSQHDELQTEHNKLQQENTRQLQDGKLQQDRHQQELTQVKLEKDSEISRLKEQSSDLQNQQSQLYQKLQAAIKAHQDTQAQLAQNQQAQIQLQQQQIVNQQTLGQQQPSLQPGLQQPGVQQQPGLQQQPGFQQPGLQQPGLQQPGLQQPGLLPQQPVDPSLQQPMGELPQQSLTNQQLAAQAQFPAGQAKNNIKHFQQQKDQIKERHKLQFSKTKLNKNNKLIQSSVNMSPNRTFKVHNAPDLKINLQQRPPLLLDKNLNHDQPKEDTHLQLRPPVHGNIGKMSQKIGDSPVQQVPAPQHHRDSRQVKGNGDGQDTIPQIKRPGDVNQPQELPINQVKPPVIQEGQNPELNQQIGDVGKEQGAVDDLARGPVVGAGQPPEINQGNRRADQIVAPDVEKSDQQDNDAPGDYPQGLAPQMSDDQAHYPQELDAQGNPVVQDDPMYGQKTDNGGPALNPLDQNAQQIAEPLQGQNNQPVIQQPEVINLENNQLQQQQQQLPPAADLNNPLQNQDKAAADDQQNMNYPKSDEDGAHNAENPDADQDDQQDDTQDHDKVKKHANQNERYQEDEEEDLPENRHDNP